jgi:hypothetical protein
MSVASITMTLLYIGMGVDGDFPPSPWWLFSSKPLVDALFTRNPSSHTKAHYLLHGLGHSPNRGRMNKTEFSTLSN